MEDQDWQPYCGVEFPVASTAGIPITCTLAMHDPEKTKHYNEQTKFQWWGNSEDSTATA